MLTAFYSCETEEVENLKADFHYAHVTVYLVVNFSFTPFANKWKLTFIINSIVWYCSVVVSGIINQGGLDKTRTIID